MPDRLTPSQIIETLAVIAGQFGGDMIQAQGRAERAEERVERLLDALDLAEGYIRACANLGDEGAKATLRMIGERRG